MKRTSQITVILAALVLAGASVASAAEGDLDSSFGSGGKVITPVGTGNDLGQAVAIQPDGKIVVAGYARTATGDDFAVVRYNGNGSLDTSFDGDGKVTTSFGANNDQGQAVALQTDGKIVVAGSTNNGTDNEFAIARYTTAGALDTTFDGDGRATVSFGTRDDEAYGVAIQTDGRIVVAGSRDAGPRFEFAVARLTTAGALDGTFGTGGTATAKYGGRSSSARAVALQSDGAIVAAGLADNGTDDDFAVVRFTTAGALDTGFDTDGKVITPIAGADQGEAVVIQPDGNILVAGTAANDFAVARYTTTGALDTTFDTDGIVTTPVGAGVDQGRGIALQTDGKIVVAGAAATPGDDFAVVRYLQGGALDLNFSGDGKATVAVGGGADLGQAVAIAPDADIVMAGYASNGTNNDFALTRHVGDETPPNTTIDSGPSGTVSSTTSTFTFSANDTAATFQCQLDGGPYLPCTSPQTYNGLSQGSHTFSVKATDPAGNEDPSPATRTWTVDTVAPNTTITSGPSGSTNLTSATFTFTSTEGGSTFECRLDGGSYAPCTSPINLTSLADGSHTLDVRATDAAGNTDPSPASRTWTVDTVAPDTSITSGPSGTASSASASFSFTSPDATATFQCQLDGGAFTSCTSPQTYNGLSQGSHTFSVKAVDPAGNEDPSPATRTWSVDTIAPNTTITTGPSGTVSADSATFTFTSSEGGSTFQCRLDGGSYAPCTSPTNYSGLADGSHTFDVRATDAAGNTDPSPATRTWTVDTVAPDTSITSGPSGTVNTTSATFTFTADDPTATFQCELDSGGYAPCTSPANYSGLADGIHTFRVKAVDGVGNEDLTAASRTWTVDIVGPVTTITSGPSGLVSSTAASFTFVANEVGSTFECRLDGGVFASCTSPRNYAGLAQGSHTFEVRATDPANNVEVTPASRTWTVDTVAPDTSITSGPSGTVTSTNATFTFSSPDGSATFQCRLDGGAYVPCISPLTYNGVGEGPHTFNVRAVDPAGNQDPTPASRTWTVDNTDPDTSIDTGPSGTVNSNAAQFTFSADEPGSTFECRLDAGAFAPCTSPTSYSGLADGSHTFEVRATDVASNTDATPATRTWTVDTVAPDTSITSGPSGTVIATDAAFTFSSSEGGSTFECRLDAGAFAPCTSPASFTALSVGPHAFDVRATDTAGNTDATPASRAWTIIPPTYQPDAMIKMLTSAAYLGDDVYADDGTGQTIKKRLARGRTASLGLAFGNDANVLDELTVKGCASEGKFRVSYAAGVDVTPSVTDGTYSAGTLAPGTDNRMTMAIKAKVKAKRGSVFNCTVRATSGGDPGVRDTVKVTIVVR